MLLTNNRQLASDICRTLLAQAGLDHRWMEAGPDELLADPAVSTTPAIKFVAALWSGEGVQTVSDLLRTADADFLVLVGALLVAAAYGDQGLRDWVDLHNERTNCHDDDEPGTVH